MQSRYYDPVTHRFINADSLASTGQGILGTNMFAYCGNNPVRRIDVSGNWWLEDAWDWVEENVFSPIAEFANDLYEDYRNYDKNNESEEDVFSSNYFSNYKGALVIKMPVDASFSFGFIGLSVQQQNTNTLKHEYGHTVQMKEMGVADYTKNVAIPSITINILKRMGKLKYDYYGAPWEAEADLLGGVNRAYNNTPWPEGVYTSYFDLIEMFLE